MFLWWLFSSAAVFVLFLPCLCVVDVSRLRFCSLLVSPLFVGFHPSSWQWLASHLQPASRCQPLRLAICPRQETCARDTRRFAVSAFSSVTVTTSHSPVVKVSGQRIAARPLVAARRSSRLVSAVFVGCSCCRLFPEHSRTLSIPSLAPRLSVCLLHCLQSHSCHIVLVLALLAPLFFHFPFYAWTRSFSHPGEVC